MTEDAGPKADPASADSPGAGFKADGDEIKEAPSAAELKPKTGLPEGLIQGAQDWFVETWLARNKPPTPERPAIEELQIKKGEENIDDQVNEGNEKEGNLDTQEILKAEEEGEITSEPLEPSKAPIPPLDDPINPPKLPLGDLWNFFNIKYIPEELFKYPTLDELSRHVEKATGVEWPLEVTWSIIRKYLHSRVKKADPYGELVRAFRVFDDEGEGCLELDDLLLVMKNPAFGDPMTEAELREFRHDANTRGDGEIHYEELVKIMFTMTPELHNVEVDFVNPPLILDWKSFMIAKNESSQEQKEQ